MKPILQNLVEMTGHRDHLRLEVSVLSTLQKLSGIIEVRALELFTDTGVSHVRPRTWIEDGQLVSTDSEAASDPRRETLDNYTALRECIANHRDSALVSPRKGCHVLWLPVWMHEKVTTCLEITQSRPFSAHKLEVVKGVFQVYQNYQRLLDYSERDALTGLFNRKTFDEQFSRTSLNGMVSGRLASAPEPLTADDASQPGEPLQQWLAVVDIDHFKQVNDLYGHHVGDRALQLFAALCREVFRAGDVVSRWGGEEFLAMLPATRVEQAQAVAQRVHAALAERALPGVEPPRVMTVSMGLSNFDPLLPLDQTLRALDDALYTAKRDGRNRTVVV